jgi:hypothetical protein
MKIIITETQLRTITEQSYMGKYEGDTIKVSHFSKRKIPQPVLSNILKSISKKVEGNATSAKFKKGEYDDIEITIFGQLLSFLKGTY